MRHVDLRLLCQPRRRVPLPTPAGALRRLPQKNRLLLQQPQVLHGDSPAVRTNREGAAACVATMSGEHDADDTRPERARGTSEHDVDCRARMVLARAAIEFEAPVEHLEVHHGRCDVHTARLEDVPVSGVANGPPAHACEDVGRVDATFLTCVQSHEDGGDTPVRQGGKDRPSGSSAPAAPPITISHSAAARAGLIELPYPGFVSCNVRASCEEFDVKNRAIAQVWMSFARFFFTVQVGLLVFRTIRGP